MFRQAEVSGAGVLPGKASSGGYFPAIDGLRAVAVLSVVLYHIDRSLIPGGFAGVDVFFVISGFVVSLATASLDTSRLTALLVTFYRRRVIRIFPALLMLIVVTQFLSVLFIPVLPKQSWDGDWTALAATFAASNITLWRSASGYFSAGPDFNPYTHTWSLGVEEQFYTLFPFIGCWFLYSRRGAGRGRLGLAIIAALSAASLAAAALAGQTFGFYMVVTRFWELGIGVLLYALLKRHDIASRSLTFAAILGSLLLAIGLAVSEPGRFPWPFALLPVAGTALLIVVAAKGPTNALSRVLAYRAMRHFGRISYSLYLWHWPVVVLMRWTVGLDSLPLKLAAGLASWGLGYASYRLVEDPIRRSAFVKRQSNARVLIAGIGGMGLVATGVIGSIVLRPYLTLSVTRDKDVWTMTQQSRGASGCTVIPVSREGAISFAPPACGTKPTRQTLYIVGDSHAIAYQRVSGNLARLDGIAVVNFGETGCAVLPRPSPASQTARCTDFIGHAFGRVVSEARAGDWLFLPGLRMPRYRDGLESRIDMAYPAQPYSEADLRAFAARIRPLLDRGVSIVLEAPKPIYTIPPMRCADWFNRANPVCQAAPPGAAMLHARGAVVTRAWGRLREIEPRIRVFDPFRLFCPGAVCQPFLGAMPVTYDGDHLSAAAQDRLTEPLHAFLTTATAPLPKAPDPR